MTCGEYDFNKVKVIQCFNKMYYKNREKIADNFQHIDYFDAYEYGHICWCNYMDWDTDSTNIKANKFKGYDNYHKEHICKTTSFGTPYTTFHQCTNINCKYNIQGDNVCGYFGSNEILIDCFSDIMYHIMLSVELGGYHAIKELENQVGVHKDIIKWIKHTFDITEFGLIGQKVYGDNNMNFIRELVTLKDNDKLFVFWTDNWTYVNDESENQAIATNLTLMEAYKLALLLGADFDYEATDNEVRTFGKELLTLSSNQDKAIEVWDYLDDIGDDFKALTGITVNDIDSKRHIVSIMSDCEEIGSLDYGGSATFIAHFLYNIIKKANLHFNKKEVAENLLSKYLPKDDYDIIGFQRALHKAMSHHEERVIDGSIWINSAKYEYVHKIIITNEEVEVYSGTNNKTIIGSIERENIQTIIEQYYHDNGDIVTNDLTECLEFDITKKNSW